MFGFVWGQDPYTEEVVHAALFKGVKTEKRDRVDCDESAGKIGGATDSFTADNFDVRVASLFAHLNTYVNFGLGLLEFARLCTVAHTHMHGSTHIVTLQPRSSSALVMAAQDEGEVHKFAFVLFVFLRYWFALELRGRASNKKARPVENKAREHQAREGQCEAQSQAR